MSYVIQTGTKGKSLTYQESAEVLLTSCDQILASKFKVLWVSSEGGGCFCKMLGTMFTPNIGP